MKQSAIATQGVYTPTESPPPFRKTTALPGSLHPVAVDEALDLGHSQRLLSSIEDGCLKIYWQPVVSSDGYRTLYHEALARIIVAGEVVSAAELISAAERTGSIQTFDQHIFEQVLDELAEAPAAVLAVNVSARSACLDGSWSDALARLKARPDIARRLVIEITETATFRSPVKAIAFVDEMRKLGCRIAIDDFGDGLASIKRLLALRPDIVKIDRFFAIRSLHSRDGQRLLERMIALAQVLSPTVIIEGIETALQSQFSEAVGATWQQGYYWGVPSAARPWHDEAMRTQDHAQRRYQTCNAPPRNTSHKIELRA